MSDRVWMSSVLSNYDLSIDQGIRTKHHGHFWEDAKIDGLNAPDEAFEASRRNKLGIALQREDFPEACAVWDERLYSRVQDVFRISTFLAVKGSIADVLDRFDLGEGGLVPIPAFRADLRTPLSEKLFLINFGARKNSFLPESSEDAQKFSVVKETGLQKWDINYHQEDADVAASTSALEGADIWFEDAVYNKIFISDELAQAIILIGMSRIFKLKECRVMGTMR